MLWDCAGELCDVWDGDGDGFHCCDYDWGRGEADDRWFCEGGDGSRVGDWDCWADALKKGRELDIGDILMWICGRLVECGRCVGLIAWLWSCVETWITILDSYSLCCTSLRGSRYLHEVKCGLGVIYPIEIIVVFSFI